MDNTQRTAGLGLLAYGLATFVAFTTVAAPGGDYADSAVRSYIDSGHWVLAFALCYLGAFGAVGLMAFGNRIRASLGASGDIVWGLAVAGAATSVVGWFLDGGVVVAMAEGGHAVQSGVPHPVVYVLTETGNLLAICSPAFFVGIGAILMARRMSQPTWIRVSCYVAGVCGILAPLYFTYFVYVLWTLVFSGWVIAGARRAAPVGESQSSLA